MKDKENQQKKALKFLELHKADKLFILANAWDVVSAKVFELEGFKAIGTTSAGVAATLGYPDGQKMKLEESLDMLVRIVKNVDLPVSVDIEAGYSTELDGVVETARQVMGTGAVGVNLEDSTGDKAKPLYDESAQVEKIEAVRKLAEDEGIHLLINARTDVFLISGKSPEQQFADTVRRANAYSEAGADCVFVPDLGALHNMEIIARLVEEIDAPLNIIAGGHTPPVAQLDEVGVSRVSLGPRPMRAALTLIRRMSQELLTSGTYNMMMDSTISYSDVNNWFGN